MVKNGETQFIIPKLHLISGKDNEIQYYGRVSDELLRYKRIQSIMIKPNMYLNVPDVEYSIYQNEMILLESFLNTNYFADLIPLGKKYNIKNITYDNATPLITQIYTNRVSHDDQLELSGLSSDQNEFAIECIKGKREVLGNNLNIWKKRFGKLSKEIIFNDTITCSFYIIIFILHDFGKMVVTIQDVKKQLREIYMKYLDKYQEKILTILRFQGKREIVDKIRSRRISFEDAIISEGYYLTDLDIWVLAQEYQLPIVLFTSTKLNNLIDSIDWLILGGDQDDTNYYFIRAPPHSLRGNEIPEYHLITPAMTLSEAKIEKYVELGRNGDAEYAKNVQSINHFFEKYLYIPKK